MAAAAFIKHVNLAVQRFEQAILAAFGKNFQPEAFCIAGVYDAQTKHKAPSTWSIKDIIGDGFLWAVPRTRRTIEKRLKRKFGYPEYVWKLLKPKTTLRTCNTCGDDHEVGVLCPTCYKKVIDETRAMQDKIQEDLKLTPVENEVVVLYSGEKDDKPAEFWQGKRIVEMPKERPSWFSKNLIQQTTQQPATTKDVKPSQLG